MGRVIKINQWNRPTTKRQRVWKLEFIPENGWKCTRKVLIDTSDASIECLLGDIVLSTARPPNCEPLRDAIFNLCLDSAEYTTDKPFSTYVI